MALLERLIRGARTWALVDGLAASVAGSVVTVREAVKPMSEGQRAAVLAAHRRRPAV